jgi:hypothetical protein
MATLRRTQRTKKKKKTKNIANTARRLADIAKTLSWPRDATSSDMRHAAPRSRRGSTTGCPSELLGSLPLNWLLFEQPGDLESLTPVCMPGSSRLSASHNRCAPRCYHGDERGSQGRALRCAANSLDALLERIHWCRELRAVLTTAHPRTDSVMYCAPERGNPICKAFP